MSRLPKFFICENLKFPESTFVIHIFYPKFMLDLIDEKLVWLEEDDLVHDKTKYLHKDIINEAIDWGIEETDKINAMREEDISNIRIESKNEFIKNFN